MGVWKKSKWATLGSDSYEDTVWTAYFLATRTVFLFAIYCLKPRIYIRKGLNHCIIIDAFGIICYNLVYIL